MDLAAAPRLYDIPLWGSLPLWVCLLLVGREIAMTVFRVGAPRCDHLRRNAGKLKTVFQNIFIGGTIAWFAFRKDLIVEMKLCGHLHRTLWNEFHGAFHRDHAGHRRVPHRVFARRVPLPVPRCCCIILRKRAQQLMDAEILTVGTELVLGFTVNGNAAVMGSLLAAAGVKVRRSAAVTDEPALIEAALEEALGRSGTVIVCGGLGPTKDDITRASAAKVFGKALRRDDAIVDRLRGWYQRRGIQQMPEANLVQADVPEGATILQNELGTAPGLWIEENGRLAVLLPGVPKELKALMEQQVIPRLVEREKPNYRTTDKPSRSRSRCARRRSASQRSRTSSATTSRAWAAA